ncbi:ABC transporter ATP-binding protein [Halalkalibacterium halodurans]|uniref:Molybdenum ABC transporter ATP-binding protein n=1 Tax=Halalkalibacterium halodurans TaxID=86665 RepID=A0A0M0KMT5_ALKHA|nr:ABC transporter ATP-binding protein [Halalkalibacterium halodurans]MED3647791.1 ABC transporter ATP-binding protein [Halalkalibacterium halodurans]TPE70147.1 ABC transporter ATP-binding protein [Halalkalibacterium halodurans]
MDVADILQVEQVTLRKAKKPILQQISWQVEQGEHWAIVGLNGSGKTSLLKIITGYEWPTEGHVAVLGNRYGQVPIQEVRKRIGWVSMSLDDRFHTKGQDTVLEIVLSGLHGTVGVYEPLGEADVAKAEAAIETFGLTHLTDERFLTLSQGERKRAFLARAWVAKPELFILDEPTTGLDLIAREQLLQTLESVATTKGAPTFLYVTHYPEEIQPFITHVLMLKDGRVVAQGRKDEVLTKETITAAFGCPLDVIVESGRYWVKPM